MTDNASAAPTARGDRDGRRRDVLAAATAILDEQGWSGFSIRQIAARAGVSTGAVYQWFSGKDEIFGELYDLEMHAGLALVDTVPDDISLAPSVRIMVDWVVDLYQRLGRYQFEFLAASRGRTGRPIAPAIAATYERLSRRTDEMLDRAAANDGIVLIRDELRILWFWSACVGTAERLTALSQSFAGPRREAMLTFSSAAITRSLVA